MSWEGRDMDVDPSGQLLRPGLDEAETNVPIQCDHTEASGST
jgi:hypothetical protein